MGSNILGHHRPRADQRVSADPMAADDGRVRAYRRPALDHRAPVFVLSADVATRVDDIGKHHAGTAKHVVFQRDAIVDGNIVLHLDVIADHHVVADKYILAEGTMFADLRAAANVHPMPDVRSLPDPGAGVDNRAVVGVIGQSAPQ